METATWRTSTRSSNNGGECVEVGAVWRKSTRSGNNGGNCVEVALAPATVAVRDSKDPGGPVLTFPAAEWAAFTARREH